MANELKLHFNEIGAVNITAKVLKPDGTLREASPIALSDAARDMRYVGDSTLIQYGDEIQFFQGTDLIWASTYDRDEFELYNILTADIKILDSTDPWTMVAYVSGTSTEIFTKYLYDINDNVVTSIATPIAQYLETAL